MVAIPASLTPVSLESPVSLANQESQAVLAAPAALTPVSLESPVSLANLESPASLVMVAIPVILATPANLQNQESPVVGRRAETVAAAERRGLAILVTPVNLANLESPANLESLAPLLFAPLLPKTKLTPQRPSQRRRLLMKVNQQRSHRPSHRAVDRRLSLLSSTSAK